VGRWFWRRRASKLSLAIRCLPEYYTWKYEVMIRDSFTCQSCGKQKCPLEIHHIYPFSKILKDEVVTSVEEAECCYPLWDTNNGITLCSNCHKEIDQYRKILGR